MKTLHDLLECGSLVAHDSERNLFVTVNKVYMRLWEYTKRGFVEKDVKTFCLASDDLRSMSLEWAEEKAAEMIKEYEGR